MALLLDHEKGSLSQPVRDHLGEQLRAFYEGLVSHRLPKDLSALAKHLENVIEARGGSPDPEFLADVMRLAPNLRAFAVSLAHNVDRAEDLVQETILRAWSNKDRFERGTCLSAWLCTILRNQFYSEHRKRVREVEDGDDSYAGSQISLPDQIDHLEMQDMAAALAQLRPGQREAILLVGVDGLTYDQAADVLGVSAGTVKSRVNRARTRLAALLDLDIEDAGGHRLSQE